MYTPYARDDGMLLQRKGKLTLGNVKSPRLSYNLVKSFHALSYPSSKSKYEAEQADSVVSLISSSFGEIISKESGNFRLLLKEHHLYTCM